MKNLSSLLSSLEDLDGPEIIRIPKRKKRQVIVEYRTRPDILDASIQRTGFLPRLLTTTKDWTKYRSYPDCRAAQEAVARLNVKGHNNLNCFEYRIRPDQCNLEMVPRNE